MKVQVKLRLSLFLSVACLLGLFVAVVSPVMGYERLIWDEYVLGTGGVFVSPVLEAGEVYRVVAEEIWWYDYDGNLAADAQYYTNDSSDSWDWGNHFPAPGNHSFLQIDGLDVDWGNFSNGDTGHRYTIYYTGEDAALSFEIVDWMDGNYTGNDCKIRVRIYESVTVGGYVVDSNPWETVRWGMTGAVILLLVIVPAVAIRKLLAG